MDKILPILEKLIKFKSVTPKGKDALDYIAEQLSQLGFKCQVKNFGSGAEETWNLYAILGNESPNICFAGHVDVVPPMGVNLWKHDPFEMVVDGDIVYGRGTVDMKGAIACYIAAVAKFLQEKPKPKGAISFLLTTDEEGDAKHGTKKMLEHIKNQQPKIDFCILGEPTMRDKVGDTVKIGRRGSVNFTLKIMGKQGHVAYPEKAINPLPIMINALKDICDREWDQGSEFFQKSNLEMVSIDVGNDTTNVIPEDVTARFNIRFNDHHTAAGLNEEIEKIVAKYATNYDLTYTSFSSPFIQKYSTRMQEFVQIVEDVCKVRPEIRTDGGTSDARFIYKHSEVVEFGLNCDLAHKINEYTQISDLQKLHDVYYNCLVKFL